MHVTWLQDSELLQWHICILHPHKCGCNTFEVSHGLIVHHDEVSLFSQLAWVADKTLNIPDAQRECHISQRLDELWVSVAQTMRV